MRESDSRLRHLQRHLGERYRFDAFLGRGGAASVYKVRNLRLERDEAIKVLSESFDEDFAGRFVQEARVAASLEHPNIITIHDFGEAEGVFWYAMQYVDGPTLRAQLRAFGAMEPAVAARLAIPLLDALEYSHQRGVIHRDIKPENIILDERGRPYLADFGIAKSDDSMLETRTGLVLGTPAYVAPEQASGRELDGRADLYALGVTLYEAMSGAFPFTADNVLQTVVMRMTQDPEPLSAKRSGIDPGLEAIVMRALTRDRELRFASAAVMAERLRHACGDGAEAWTQPLAIPTPRPLEVDSSDSGAATVMDRSRRTMRMRRRELGLAAAAALALAVAVTVWTSNRWPGLERSSEAPVMDRTVADETAADRPVSMTPVPEPESVEQPGQRPTQSVESPSPTVAPPTRVAPTPEPPPRRAMFPPQIRTRVSPHVSPDVLEVCAGEGVVVSLVVSEEGRALDARAARGPTDARCKAAAEDAVRQWTFEPALDVSRAPVNASLTVRVEFEEAP